MSTEQQNPFTMWNDLNSQMMDAWSTWASKAVSTPTPGATANPFNAYYDFFTKSFTQNPFTSNFQVPGVEYAQQLYKTWADGMQNLSAYIPNQNVKDGFERFMSAFSVFTGLQSYWDSFLKNMPKDMNEWETFAQTAMQQYQSISQNLAASFAPEQLKAMLSVPMEGFNTMQQTLVQLFQPWLDSSAELQNLFMKALQGDKGAYAEFLEEWNKTFKGSTSKLLNMPVVGANRTSVEKMMKLLDDFIKFSIRYSELSQMFSGMTTTAMERIMARLAELNAEGKQPQTFMEFYSIWSSFNEQAANEVYSTEAFAKIMNETVSAGSKLQIMFDDFMQDILAFLPLPNRRELDDVEQEVYKLRKTVKTLEKELKDIKTMLAGLPVNTPTVKQ